MFQNKSKYTILVLFVRNREESEKYQRLAHRYGITWAGHSQGFLYDLGSLSTHIYISLNDSLGGQACMRWSRDLDLPYLSDFVWKKRVYTIENYNEVNDFLRYDGKPTPSYNPKKFDRNI